MQNMHKHQRSFCVYVHRRATDGIVFYVGTGTLQRSRSKSGRSKAWVEQFAACGRVVQVVDSFDSPVASAAAEIELIALLRAMGVPLVNKTAGGEGGPKGLFCSFDEARDNLVGKIQSMEGARVARMAERAAIPYGERRRQERAQDRKKAKDCGLRT